MRFLRYLLIAVSFASVITSIELARRIAALRAEASRMCKQFPAAPLSGEFASLSVLESHAPLFKRLALRIAPRAIVKIRVDLSAVSREWATLNGGERGRTFQIWVGHELSLDKVLILFHADELSEALDGIVDPGKNREGFGYQENFTLLTEQLEAKFGDDEVTKTVNGQRLTLFVFPDNSVADLVVESVGDGLDEAVLQ